MTQIVPSVTVAVTPPDLPATLTPALLGGLIKELAIGLRDVEDILHAYKIDRATYEKLTGYEYFKKAVDAASLEWHAATNTITRLQLEAAFSAEQALPLIYARAVNGKEPLNHSVDFLKWLTDLGGLKKEAGQGQTGDRYKITINLGADRFEFEGARNPISGDPALAAIPVSEIDDKEDRV